MPSLLVLRRHARDSGLALLLAAAAALGTWQLASRVPTAVLDPRHPDVYFSSDTSRVHANMAARESNHWRTCVHPLFSLLLHPVFQATAWLTRSNVHAGPLSPGAISVGRGLSAAVAALCLALFFALLRAAGVRPFDAVLFCALAAVSAFAVFWFAVPETYPWGCATILFAVLLAALGRHRPPRPGWYLAASVLTLSMTTTNWMVGLAATWTRLRWRRAVIWSGFALGIVLSLSIAQRLIYPSSRFFFRASGERNYVLPAESGGALRCWSSFVSHTVIMPALRTVPHPRVAGLEVLRTQRSAPASATPWGAVALGCWLLLLVAGIHALVTLPDIGALRVTLAIALIGQLALHTLYGAETFLYSAHYGPLLVAVAALGTRTRFRPAVLVVAGVMIVCAAVNNLTQFSATLRFLAHLPAS